MKKLLLTLLLCASSLCCFAQNQIVPSSLRITYFPIKESVELSYSDLKFLPECKNQAAEFKLFQKEINSTNYSKKFNFALFKDASKNLSKYKNNASLVITFIKTAKTSESAIKYALQMEEVFSNILGTKVTCEVSFPDTYLTFNAKGLNFKGNFDNSTYNGDIVTLTYKQPISEIIISVEYPEVKALDSSISSFVK